MRRFVAYGPAFVVLVAVMITLLAAPAAIRRIGDAQTASTITLARHALEEDDILERLNRAVQGVATAVEPSVVHLDVQYDSGERRSWRRSTGSGWVYDAQGHVVTNAHVVRGAERIVVQFQTGRVTTAELMGADPFTDIAVLKVDAGDGLHPARRATGAHPRQGERVFAFGSPFGFKFSMSEGIISGVGRDPQQAIDFGGYTNFIQTDAAVNPGNSGGPLADIKGRVIGMNVAIATGRDTQGTTEGQSAGISFAIPLATIESVVDQLIAHGRVTRGFLGIGFRGSEEPITDRAGFVGLGVVVGNVTAGGPSAEAGLADGDIITALDGQGVAGWEMLRSIVGSMRPGDQVEVKYWREGRVGTTRVVLGEMPGDDMTRRAVLSALREFGLMLREADGGLLVVYVVDDSDAAKAGFEAGNIIVTVAGTPLAGADALVRAMAEADLLLGRRVSVSVVPTDETDPEPKDLSIRIGR